MAILVVTYDSSTGGFRTEKIGSAQISDGAIVSGKIASGIVGLPHLEPWASGKVLVGQGTTTTPITKDHMAAIAFVIDGGGSVITSGTQGKLEIPFPATIAHCRLLADQSGCMGIDIRKGTYTGYEGIAATDSICSGTRPILSSAMKYQDTTLTGWNKTIASGDILAFVVDAGISNVTRCVVSLGVYK